MTDNPLIPKEDNAPSVPGIGMSGMVMCPFGFQRSPCLKQGCELWVELYYSEKKVGRCSFAWNAIIATETKQVLGQAVIPAGPIKKQKDGNK